MAARTWTDGSGTALSAANLNALEADLTAAGVALLVAATRTASATVTIRKHNPFDATTTALTATLPTGSAAGTVVSVEKFDSSVNAVTVSGSIRGSAGTIALVLAHETVQLVADAAGSWWPTLGHKTLASLDARYPANGVVLIWDGTSDYVPTALKAVAAPKEFRGPTDPSTVSGVTANLYDTWISTT